MSQFLEGNHCIRNTLKRNKTHLINFVSEHDTKFLEITKSQEREFYEHFICDKKNWIISEYATRPTFRLYFDVDYIGPIILNIIEIAQILNKIIGLNNFILITGCPPIIVNTNNFKQGYHLRCPNIIVNENMAITIRSTFIAELEKK